MRSGPGARVKRTGSAFFHSPQSTEGLARNPGCRIRPPKLFLKFRTVRIQPGQVADGLLGSGPRKVHTLREGPGWCGPRAAWGLCGTSEKRPCGAFSSMTFLVYSACLPSSSLLWYIPSPLLLTLLHSSGSPFLSSFYSRCLVGAHVGATA